MEYDDEDNGAAGSLPEFGAIFMSSIVMEKECFKRKLFALPSSQAEFVKRVKAGMVLFLFEFERRQLHGVYQACSDGAMDIDPHAFSYSGKHFPAQVSFTPIWYCNPLSEKEFRDAIIENYFSPKKFNFGLNENQVRRLLYLFSSRKMESRLPLAQGGFLAKRRRINSDDKVIRNDVAENEIVNLETLQAFPSDSPKDALDEVRRVDDALRVDRNFKDNQAGNFHSVLCHGYLGSLDVRASVDDQFMWMNKSSDKYNMERGSGLAFASECYGSPLNQSKHQGGRFLFDERVAREQNVHEIVRPTAHGDANICSCRRDSHQNLLNGNLNYRYHLNYDGGQVSSFEQPASLLDKRIATKGGNISVKCGSHKPNFISTSMEDFSSEESPRPLHSGQRLLHDRKYPNMEGRVTETTMDGILYSSNSSRNAGYFENVGEWVDDGRFRMSQRATNKEDIHTLINPATSMEYPYLPEQKQNIHTLFDKLPEKRHSQLSEASKFDPSSSLFEDATITRAVPYVPEHPSYSHACSASTANDWKNSLLQETHYQHGFPENLYSPKIRSLSSPYFLVSNVSTRSLKIAPEHGDNALRTNTSGQPSSFPRENSPSLLTPSMSMQTAENTSAPVNYGDSSFSECSLASLPSPIWKNIEREEGYLAAYPLKLNKGRFAFDGNLTKASRVPWEQRDVLVTKPIISSEANDFGIDAYDQARNLASNNNPFMNHKEHHGIFGASRLNSSGDRRSVFTRLTFRQGLQVDGERNTFESNDCYMNTSADEVLGMLQQGNNLKKHKFEVVGKLQHGESELVGKLQHGQSATDEKLIQNHTDLNPPRKEKKHNNKTCFDIAESVDEVLKESRIVSFKRRSDTKKTPGGTSNDSTADNKISGVNGVAERSTVKTVKRKKLVRPVFGKIESNTDTTCTSQNSQLLVTVRDVNQSCKKAISRSDTDMRDDRLGDVSDTSPDQSLECNAQEHLNLDVQKDIGTELEGDKKPSGPSQEGCSNLPKGLSQQ